MRRGTVNTALILPFQDGGTDGVDARTTMITKQMCGRAGSTLLRYGILLGLPRSATTDSGPEPKTVRSTHFGGRVTLPETNSYSPVPGVG